MLAKKAVEINDGIDSLDTLAAAYAANGQFGEAISTQKRVIHMLVQQDRIDRLAPYLDHLNTYKAGKPLRIKYATSTPRIKTEKFGKLSKRLPTATCRHLWHTKIRLHLPDPILIPFRSVHIEIRPNQSALPPCWQIRAILHLPARFIFTAKAIGIEFLLVRIDPRPRPKEPLSN